jgi:hypothetical protein
VQEVASRREVRSLQGIDFARWPKIAKRLLKGAGLLKSSSVRERHFHFDPEILQLRGSFHLDGYWQSEKYFADAEEAIRKDFSFREAADPANAALAAQIQAVQAVSVHVRRGDYVSNRVIGLRHGSSTLDYYQAALEVVQGRVVEPHYFVFSDEPQWAKDNLKIAGPAVYVEHNGPDHGCRDLQLMALCRHHVIANSSFSWWGAWLAQHAGQTVIAPKAWFNSADTRTDDLIPQGWLRL